MAAALLAAFWLLAVWPSSAKAENGDGLSYFFDQVLNDPLDKYDNVTSFNKTFRRDGWKRNVLYMKPVTPVVENPPLLVILHFRGGNAKDMANLVQVGRLIRDHGAWALLPDALSGNWRKNPAERTNIDDVAFIDAAIADALANYPVDPKRVYVMGFSDGAFMALRYACDHSERLAAGFVVAGAMLKSLADQCAPSNTLPFVFINGTSDMNVNYNGSVGVLSAPDTAMYWASLNACTAKGPAVAIPNLVSDGTTSSMETYSQCIGDKDVDFYTVNKGGHTWPGVNAKRPMLGRTSYDFSATDAAWEFFGRFAQP
ncbi:MAG TPA: PHB depolymerase family esterase [Nevskiaceae bacterium]|nr:PHB depolymerase family esterase [Nevskiaceae bacterium]